MRLSKFILGLLFMLSLSACVNYEEVEITDIKSIRLVELTDRELQVETEVEIENPNSFEITVVESSFRVTVEDKAIGTASILDQVSVAGNSKKYYKLLLNSSLEDLEQNAMTNLLAITASGKDNIKFKIDGYIIGKALFNKRKVQISREGEVPLKLF